MFIKVLFMHQLKTAD